jgi:hypothetical protein
MLALLGALSVVERLERECTASNAPHPALAADDALVLAALGALGLGRSLRRWLAEAATPAALVSTTAADVPALGELLR